MATTSDIVVDGVTTFGQADSYRYILTLQEKKLSIWLENRSSKKQWKSGSLSKTDFVTPANLFKQVLNVPVRETCDSHRELNPLNHNKLQLKLIMNARVFDSVRKATYEFELLPVSVDRIDIMESKLRDVQEQQSLVPVANVWLYHESRGEVSCSSKLLWNDLKATDFKVVPDKTAIEWQVPGVFSIGIVISHSETSFLGSIVLWKNNTKIQTIVVGGSGENRIKGSGFVKATSTLMCISMMKRGDQISVSFTGTSPTAPAYLTVVRIGQ
ncbi:hypothetical protein PHMEG_00032594 [Phytophthora megakarya]|uniref:Uncharacterized protein n=1 Tax=Phytophthora megakarya TaxID=4795 RepID=A0A225UW22_9STRA|nr:hypothetical protein PHMEG_00032594 [Phytophthora megakarya]